MSRAATNWKVLVSVAASYVASALNLIGAYVSLAALGPALIGLFQSMVLIKQYALYANLGEVQAVRKTAAELVAAGDETGLRDYERQTFSLALLTILAVAGVLIAGERLAVRLPGVRALTFYAAVGLYALEYLQYFFGNQLGARNRYEEWSKGAVLLASSSLVLLALIVPFGYAGYLTGRLAAAAIFLGYLVRRMRPVPWLTTSFPRWREIVRTGVPMSVLGVLALYVTSADRVAVAWLMDDRALGVYSLVSMCALPVVLFAQTAASVLFTRSSQQRGQRSTDVEIVADVVAFVRVTDRIVPNVVFALVFMLPWLVATFLPAYTGGVVAAQLALMGYGFYGVSTPFANVYVVLDRTRASMAIAALSGTVSLALSAAALRSGLGLPGVGLSAAVGLTVYSAASIAGVLGFTGAASSRWSAARHTGSLLRKNALCAAVGAAALMLLKQLPAHREEAAVAVAGVFLLAAAPAALALARSALRTAGVGQPRPSSSPRNT